MILTLGKSRTVELFLKAAAKDRKFTVIVAETGPSYAGHSTARVLSLAGISTLLVPDSSIFALMPRVSKVVLGAHAVLANGGLLGAAGSSATALAAGAHSTPLVVLAGLFKVCPEWGWVETSSSRGGIVGGGSGPPAQVLDFGQDGCVGGASLVEQVEVVNPLWDYVGPESVDVFITNVGEHPPSYVYRLIKENYDEADLML